MKRHISGTHCFSGTLLEMSEAFPVLLRVALLAPSGGALVRRGLLWRGVDVMYASVCHAGKVLGTVVADDGGIVPPGRGTGAEEEPEDAGRAAVEKDALVRMHGEPGIAVGDLYMLGGTGGRSAGCRCVSHGCRRSGGRRLKVGVEAGPLN